MPPQMPPDESVIVKEPTPPCEIETLTIEEWVDSVLAPRRVEILTMLATTIYDHHKQLAIKNQQVQETDDEQAD